MTQTKRSEDEIFNELEKLCIEDGYANAIAYFCFRDTTYKFKKELDFDAIKSMFDNKSLIRTEISCLIGLMSKGSMCLAMPDYEIHQRHILRTEQLLEELHYSIAALMFNHDENNEGDKAFNSDTSIHSSGEFIREGILYGSESAYAFQYQDLFYDKYIKDCEWFKKNKGYDIPSAVDVFTALMELRNDKANTFVRSLPPKSDVNITYLPSLTFKISEIEERTTVGRTTIKNIIRSFQFKADGISDNNSYSRIDDFNLTNAYPFIEIDEDEYLLFLTHSLFEAIYETPFFWLNEDKNYSNIAMKNRGDFTENFTTNRLIKIFGDENVHQNINIYVGKKRIGEIDTLVMYAGKAIIVQAKSKKLTLNARRGDDKALRDDFKKAIQNAYDQGYLCATYLNVPNAHFLNEKNEELQFKNVIDEAFIICVLSDHYPALSFQARQYLTINEHDIIKNPFITDVFFIDILCELLTNPLYVLAYLSQRTRYNHNLISSNEIVTLGYHLKANLWLEEENSLYMLDNDLAANIDIAMIAIRRNVPGNRIPEGILTRFKDTFFDFILKQLSFINDSNAFTLGKFLLLMSEESIREFNKKADASILKAEKDAQHHDLTLFIDGTGLIIHSNSKPLNKAIDYLNAHCSARKYKMKSDLCYGILLSQLEGTPPILITQNDKWTFSPESEEITEPFFKKKETPLTRDSDKIGRNASCPCGSNLKYKKCCLNK
ncbi:SEC-C metal-binding domain-containing protein [Pantoea ananatis]|uniref:SEC-C metal-binding domain-containing protein n=1 Tax=Pantoea ananas TaxID=553 RepID=UPI001B300F2C|nr:SEC-C metal-binding domain-containing protein [Pantoea ananatis]